MHALDLLQKLIQCKSVTPQDDGAIDLLYRVLSNIGFKCNVYEFQSNDSYKVKNLYARFGNNRPNFCFAGHTDVVSSGDSSLWSFGPFDGTINNNHIYGRGTVDMKGAIACMIEAVAKFIQQPFAGSVSFLITGDEEGDAINGTQKLLKHILNLDEKIDACVVGEPTSSNTIGDTIKIGRRGSINFTLSVLGTSGHVAYPELADNPISSLVNILHNIKQVKLDNGNDKFDASNLEITSIDAVNNTTNMIPFSASARFNIRFNDIQTPQALHQLIFAICERSTKHFTLEYACNSQAFYSSSDNFTRLVSQAIHCVTNDYPILSTSGGTSDARFIKDYCPTVEVGLLNKTAHKTDEYCKLKNIEKLTDIYYQILCHYFK